MSCDLYTDQHGAFQIHVVSRVKRGKGKTRVVDPDPHGSSLTWLSWIRIRNGNADPDPGARKLAKINR
jgi:hypothetical protein